MYQVFIEAGHKLTVFNRSPEKTDAVRRMGAMVAETPAEVSENSDLVFTMLSDDVAVEEIFRSENGLINGNVKDRLFIDMSTIKPETTIRIAREIQEKSASFIDAPVSGTVAPAAKGAMDQDLC